jgi:hypothetical protein
MECRRWNNWPNLGGTVVYIRLLRALGALSRDSLSATDVTGVPVKAGHELVFAALRQSLIVKTVSSGLETACRRQPLEGRGNCCLALALQAVNCGCITRTLCGRRDEGEGGNLTESWRVERHMCSEMVQWKKPNRAWI